MNENMLSRKHKGLREFQMMLAFAVLILIFYTLLYVSEPFSEFWNNFFSNFTIIFSAGLGTLFAVRVFQRYDPADLPRRIWVQLAIGLGLWTLAETVWTIYNTLYGEVGITVSDIFWVCAYGFFAHAVYLQYQVIFHPSQRVNMKWLLIWLTFTFSLTLFIAGLLIQFIEEEWGGPLLINSFYPAADLAIGIAALRVVRSFRGGALGYPWLGLFGFAIADMFYAVLELGGFYAWDISAGDVWSTAADITYTAAYLFVALGCFAQLLLLKHGPIFTTIRKDIKRTI